MESPTEHGGNPAPNVQGFERSNTVELALGKGNEVRRTINSTLDSFD